MAEAQKRYHEIDLLKGLACYLMLTGHALRAAPGGFDALSVLDKIVIYAMDFSGPLFFTASGMNVCTFFDRNHAKPGFAALRFYLGQAALLFVLGYTYSLAIGSLAVGIPDIFQGVAVCTAAMYLLVALRLPAFAYLGLLFALYAVYWPFRAEIEALMTSLNCAPTWSSIEPSGREAVMAAARAVRELPLWKRQLFAHFGVFPWLSFFFVGAAVYRVRSRVGEIALAVFFLAMIVASVWLPQPFFSSPFELFFRGLPPGYVLQTGGASGLLFLAGRHLYKGAGTNRLWSGLEFAGRESFLLLILHFFLITVSVVFLPGLNMYARSVLIIAGTAFLLPRFARRRDVMAARPGFEKRMLVLLAVFFAAGLFVSAAPPLYVVARLFGFASAFAFAFVFGNLRTRMRSRCTLPRPAADAATGV